MRDGAEAGLTEAELLRVELVFVALLAAGGVECVDEGRIVDMQLVGRDADDRACIDISMWQQECGSDRRGMRTVLLMQLLELERVLATLDAVVVVFVP